MSDRKYYEFYNHAELQSKLDADAYFISELWTFYVNRELRRSGINASEYETPGTVLRAAEGWRYLGHDTVVGVERDGRDKHLLSVRYATGENDAQAGVAIPSAFVDAETRKQHEQAVKDHLAFLLLGALKHRGSGA